MDRATATPDAKNEVVGDEGNFSTPQNDNPEEETTFARTSGGSDSSSKISKPAQLLRSVLRSNSKDLDAESTKTSKVTNANTSSKEKKHLISWRHTADQKVVGLKRNALDQSTYEKRHRMMVGSNHSRRSVNSKRDKGGPGTSSNKKFSVEEKEEEARAKAMHNPFLLLCLGNLAAVKVMLFYLSKFS